ncbi:MAG: class I SAM-dependent methyltransferase [Gammaproteobacteria bacterium]
MFFKKFWRQPKANGSLYPSSKFACRAMLSDLPLDELDTIVELGPGTGVFTQYYLKGCRADATIVLFESDPDFQDYLKARFADDKRIVFAGNALELSKTLQGLGIARADLILSSLPVSLGNTLTQIMHQVAQNLGPEGIFRCYTYAPVLARKYYRDLGVRKLRTVVRNLPPMWIYGSR